MYCSPITVIWEVGNGAGLAAVLGSCFVMIDSVDCLQYAAEFV